MTVPTPDDHFMTSSALRQRQMTALSEPYGGVLSRELLREAGVDKDVITRQVDGARWRLHGRETVATHTQNLSPEALAWRAVWEVACPDVALDGVSAMQAARLTGFDAALVDVSIPWEARVARVEGVRIHRVFRGVGDVVGPGIPRVRTALAAVRAAHWASSDRQAALLLALPVQQRLLPPARLLEASKTDRVRGRRALVRLLARDIADGAQSLGELDFAKMCRRRGLPEPDRQAVTETTKGRVYLDVRWSPLALVVEIDGSGHVQGLASMDDNFRQNRVALGDNTVFRYGLVDIRVRSEAVLDQLCEAHAVLAARRAA